MRYFKCILEYDGTNYSGWQRQQNTPMTIQEKVEDALKMIEKAPVSVLAASRTDAGVHARGQVIAFSLESRIPVDRITIAMNSQLPRDIRIKLVEEVDADFHPRFQAVKKTYHYYLETGPIQSVFRRDYAYHVSRPLSLSAMEEGAKYLVGTHDFSSFRAAGCSAKSPIRTIEGINVIHENELVRLEYTGNGFLYNMVRILTGTLVYVGLNKFTPEMVKQILQAKDRTLSGITAPAQGLFLIEVFY